MCCGKPFITEWPYVCRGCGCDVCGDCIDDGYCHMCAEDMAMDDDEWAEADTASDSTEGGR